MSNAFHWQGKPSVFTQDAPNFRPPVPRKPSEPGTQIASKSRAPTSSINTERKDKLQRVKGAAI